MSKQYYFLQELKLNNSIHWKIQVRVTHMWMVPIYGSPNEFYSKDMILIDEKGNRIHATIKKKLVHQFHSISAGSTYLISNFGVSKYLSKLLYNHLPYKVIFNKTTSVKKIDLPGIQRYGFNFMNFDEIHNTDVDPRYLIDIIGNLVAVGAMDNHYERRNIYLRSSRNEVLKCTLWNEYAHQFDDHSINFDATDNIVVLIHLAAIKEFGGQHYISNAKGATVVFVDECRLSEIMDFKNMFPMTKELLDHLNIPMETNQPTLSLSEIFLSQTDSKTISEILSTTEKCACITMATIEAIDDTFGWFYNSCQTCKSKVEVDGTKYKCKKCVSTIKFVVPRFKLHLKVTDDSGSTDFIMFEKQVKQLVSRSVTAIQDSLDKDIDINSIPPELNDILNKTYLFKIFISEYNLGQTHNSAAGYTVNNITNDPDIIKEFIIMEVQRVVGLSSPCIPNPKENGKNLMVINDDESSEDSEDSEDSLDNRLKRRKIGGGLETNVQANDGKSEREGSHPKDFVFVKQEKI